MLSIRRRGWMLVAMGLAVIAGTSACGSSSNNTEPGRHHAPRQHHAGDDGRVAAASPTRPALVSDVAAYGSGVMRTDTGPRPHP